MCLNTVANAKKAVLRALGEAFEAVYEGGVLKPIGRVNLPEGAKVPLKVEAVKPRGLIEFVENFIALLERHGAEVREDPLRILLRIRER